MLNIEEYDFELPQIGKSPTMGYSDEYVEKTMLSGKIRRIYDGKRFSAKFSYGFLTDTQIAQIKSLLEIQREQGYLNVEISNPFGEFSGEALVDLNSEQTRFTYNKADQSYTWINWSLTVKAVDLSDD